MSEPFFKNFLLGRFPYMQVVTLHNQLGNLHHFIGYFIRHVNLKLDVVVILLITTPFLHMFWIIWIVVYRSHCSQLVKTKSEHSFWIEIRKAQRSDHFRHPFALSVFFYGLHQGRTNLQVVNKVYPSKANTLAIPLLIGTMVDNGGNPTDNTSILTSDETFCFTKFKRGILILAQRTHIITEEIGYVVFVAFI